MKFQATEQLRTAAARLARLAPEQPLVPMLACAVFRCGHGQSSDNSVTLNIPVDVGGAEFAVNAVRLSAALSVAGPEAELSLGEAQLTIKGGRFTARIELLDTHAFPWTDMPTASRLPAGDIIKAIQAVSPFASGNGWSSVVALSGSRAMASDGASLLITAPGVPDIDCSLPAKAAQIAVLLSGDANEINIDDHALTFFSPDGSWLRASLVSTEWPNVSSLIPDPSALPSAPLGLWDAVSQVVVFGDGPVCLAGNLVSRDSAEIAIDFALPNCAFLADVLLVVAGVSSHIDLTKYPRCPFGNPMSGVAGSISGVRHA